MTGTSASPRRAAATCLLAAALAGCGSSSGGNSTANSTAAALSTTATAASTSATGASTVLVTIKNFGYATPASVSPGATVTVRNEDPTEHTVTADGGNAFDVQVSAGGTATFTAPTQPGSYPFHCSIHPFMKATLVVK